jgi:hypothetical protein
MPPLSTSIQFPFELGTLAVRAPAFAFAPGPRRGWTYRRCIDVAIPNLSDVTIFDSRSKGARTRTGFSVATIETHEIFFFPKRPRGKFAGKSRSSSPNTS